MAVEILYCPTLSGYDTRAASLAAEITRELGIDTMTTPGARSQFDVVVDGRLVYSKQDKGRFPEDGEVVRLLAPEP